MSNGAAKVGEALEFQGYIIFFPPSLLSFSPTVFYQSRPGILFLFLVGVDCLTIVLAFLVLSPSIICTRQTLLSRVCIMALDLQMRFLCYTEPSLFVAMAFLGNSTNLTSSQLSLMLSCSIPPRSDLHRTREEMGGFHQPPDALRSCFCRTLAEARYDL